MLASETLLEKMGQFGLNKYEAKAYIGLLQHPQVTAYELGKQSGVPQGKIYETMGKLLEKNLANVVSEDPVKYVAVSLDHYVDEYTADVTAAGDYLKKEMENINKPVTLSYMMHLDGEQATRQKLQELIARARSFIYLETWGPTYDHIAPLLKEKVEEGVEVVSVILGKSLAEVGRVYHHEMEGMEENSHRLGHWLTIVVDGEEALFATEEEGAHQAIWTRNKAFMLMAESFILHDIFLCEIYGAYKNELDQTFGPNLAKIREKLRI